MTTTRKSINNIRVSVLRSCLEKGLLRHDAHLTCSSLEEIILSGREAVIINNMRHYLLQGHFNLFGSLDRIESTLKKLETMHRTLQKERYSQSEKKTLKNKDSEGSSDQTEEGEEKEDESTEDETRTLRDKKKVKKHVAWFPKRHQDVVITDQMVEFFDIVYQIVRHVFDFPPWRVTEHFHVVAMEYAMLEPNQRYITCSFGELLSTMEQKLLSPDQLLDVVMLTGCLVLRWYRRHADIHEANSLGQLLTSILSQNQNGGPNEIKTVDYLFRQFMFWSRIKPEIRKKGTQMKKRRQRDDQKTHSPPARWVEKSGYFYYLYAAILIVNQKIALSHEPFLLDEERIHTKESDKQSSTSKKRSELKESLARCLCSKQSFEVPSFVAVRRFPKKVYVSAMKHHLTEGCAVISYLKSDQTFANNITSWKRPDLALVLQNMHNVIYMDWHEKEKVKKACARVVMNNFWKTHLQNFIIPTSSPPPSTSPSVVTRVINTDTERLGHVFKRKKQSPIDEKTVKQEPVVNAVPLSKENCPKMKTMVNEILAIMKSELDRPINTEPDECDPEATEPEEDELDDDAEKFVRNVM